MVELINFSKTYKSSKKGDSFAVSNFSMTCKNGEITGILGLNGAGKTTILKAICARHVATKGDVLVDGINASENIEKIREITGFVQEEPDLPKEYTVEEYLRLTASLHKIDFKAAIKSEKSHITELFLDELLPKKIKALSKGQRERVNFAQALIYNPCTLVLDEPASGLDPAQIINMRALVKSLKKDHTIILSTHLMQEVDSLCDRVYIINDGKLAASGTPQEIINENNCKNLEDAFFKITSSRKTRTNQS